MSSQSNSVFPEMLMIVGQLPVFLVWLVGLIVAIVRWGRHPRVSGLILVGVFAAAGATFGAHIAFRLVPILFDGGDPRQIFPLISVVSSLIHAFAWACLLMAALASRETVTRNTPFDTKGGLPPPNPPKSGGT